MRILLDECLPARLGRDLAGHDVSTAPKMGVTVAGCCQPGVCPRFSLGETEAKGRPPEWWLLVRAVEAGFDVFLTVDRNLPKEQKLAAYAIAVVVLRCATNDIFDLKKLVPELLAKLPAVKKGEAVLVG